MRFTTNKKISLGIIKNVKINQEFIFEQILTTCLCIRVSFGIILRLISILEEIQLVNRIKDAPNILNI